MNSKSSTKFSSEVLLFPLFFGLLIWTVYWFEIQFGYDFTTYGVYPRSLKGLLGIIFSPFIHSSVEHLYNNTLPLIILSTALFYFYNNVRWKVLLFGILGSGILTWIFARSAYHIGASGVIYLLSSFIFFRGIIAKHFRLVAVSLIVVFLYGSLIWYVFPIDKKISWEGHLSGFAMGVLFAFIFKEKLPKKTRFKWEQPDYNENEDPFLKHFDAEGNFVSSSELEEKESKDNLSQED